MTANIQKPFIHVEDSNGNPYVGALLYVYEVGTTTLASIYSDTSLSVSVVNPLSGANASDAAGNFPRVYIASGTYKLRAETADGTLIWQYDNIDTCLTSGSGALAISAGGTSATTAASARTALGAAAQTDVDTLSTSVAVIQNTLSSLSHIPNGRLTPTSATPVISSDVTAATSVYYTPYIGELCPIYDGTKYVLYVFAELTLSLVSNHLASSLYDVFVFLDGSTVTVGTGPAWNSATAGASSRGTGAGTTELSRIGGLWVNTVAMTARNGSSTYSVAANEGTYVGTIFMDATNGQVSCYTSWGGARKWGVWNTYNRELIKVKAGDSTASWTYNTATVRQSRGISTTTAIAVFSGLAEEGYDFKFMQHIAALANLSTGTGQIGVGVNTTTIQTELVGFVSLSNNSAVADTVEATVTARYSAPPSLGLNNIFGTETSSATGTTTYFGTTASMALSAEWWG